MVGLALPQGVAEWVVLAAAAGSLLSALVFRERAEHFVSRHPRKALALLALLALAGSAAYIHVYLRGGPRIIDATSYWLEARAMARGYLAFPTPEPLGSFRGRFLLSPPGGTTLAVLFPPGYPALLALGFLSGAPMAVGPILAALLTLVTFGLTRRAFGRDDVALLAAALSALCAALRYHTADTMSHGLAAVLFAATLWAALVGGRALLLAGLLAGWLVATRPVTGLTSLLLVGMVVGRTERARLPLMLLGMLPGLALLAAHQKAATGSYFSSAQLRYYALADGPPGCFRYGFGSGIGCLFEHGDFVQAHLADGYGLAAALGTTGRRLWLHALDIGNGWPLALVVPWALWVGRRDAAVRVLGFGAVGLVLAYAPFYFDGNYPGGGARLLAEALPLEHALVAWGLVRLRVARFAPSFAMAAFALYAARDHRALAAREGGRPMFDPDDLARSGVRNGLVLVATDHGFNLAHRPGELDASRGIVVARKRDDAHDRTLWERLGRPPAFVYHRAAERADGYQGPTLEPFRPGPSRALDGGALWPASDVRQGWLHPDWPAAACASGAYALRFRGTAAEATLLPTARAAGRHRVIARWVALADGPVEVTATAAGRSWTTRWEAFKDECREVAGPELELPSGDFPLVLEVRGNSLALAVLEVRPDPSPDAFRKSVDN